MGLDQYLYRVKDMDKFKELFKSINDLINESDEKYKILSSEFKEKHADDIKLFKEKLIELSPDLREENIDRFGEKLLELVRIKLNPELESREAVNELLLYKIFLLVDTFELNEDVRLLREKAINKIIPLLEDLVKRLNKKEKENIIEFESLVNKFDRTLYKFYSTREVVSYWRKANMIHGWFLKNVSWIEDNVTTEVFKGSLLDKLITDIETVISLIEDNFYVDSRFIIAEGGSLYDKIVELLPPTSGCFFGSTNIDNNYYKLLKSTLEDLKDKYDPDDNYYYVASW